MKIQTKYHGTREYQEEDILTFPKGLPGFEELRKFIIFSVEDNEIFQILHSVEDASVGIVIISPFYVMEQYEVQIPEHMLQTLQIENQEQVVVYTTVTLNSKLENITTNLKAPILINIKARLGEQLILDHSSYKVKHPLLKEADKC